MRDRIFYSICFGFTLGVLLRSFFVLDIYITLFLLLLSVSVFMLSHFSTLRWGVTTSVFAFTVMLGILRFDMANNPPSEYFELQVGQRVNFLGEIVDEPDIRENNQKLTVEVLGVDNTKNKILVSVDLAGDFSYGDRINFSGRLEKPENFITDQGKNFDYINYLRKDGIFYSINFAEVEVVSSGNGNPVRSALFKIKGKFLEKINLIISEPENLLMGGLILGERAAFSAELREQFIATGTIHIVALSGYNVTIVADWIMKMFYFLPINMAIWAGIGAIFLFVIMAGGQSTAVRAGVMASLALLARVTGRTYDVARALVLAGVLMILFNPLVLVHDVSFQLSFMATVAVIFLGPKFEKYFEFITKSFDLRGTVAITCAAYIFVLPFILYKMGNLSFMALPANFLVLPFIPPTMLLGFTAGFIGIFSHIVAVPVGFLANTLLSYELWVIDFLASVPHASITIPDFPLIITILIYLFFIYHLFGAQIKNFFTMLE